MVPKRVLPTARKRRWAQPPRLRISVAKNIRSFTSASRKLMPASALRHPLFQADMRTKITGLRRPSSVTHRFRLSADRKVLWTDTMTTTFMAAQVSSQQDHRAGSPCSRRHPRLGGSKRSIPTRGPSPLSAFQPFRNEEKMFSNFAENLTMVSLISSKAFYLTKKIISSCLKSYHG
jgi:hypothetical protein